MLRLYCEFIIVISRILAISSAICLCAFFWLHKLLPMHRTIHNVWLVCGVCFVPFIHLRSIPIQYCVRVWVLLFIARITIKYLVCSIIELGKSFLVVRFVLVDFSKMITYSAYFFLLHPRSDGNPMPAQAVWAWVSAMPTNAIKSKWNIVHQVNINASDIVRWN